ncbi:MAG TPA: VCBS repeat-containing protein [Fimbriiglobus sp.]|nr:VCBS repeat-containing protein [Fimbriiglobus sp.]
MSESTLRFRPQVRQLERREVPSVVPADAIVIGPAEGGNPQVVVVDPESGKSVFKFVPFEKSFRGGASVAVGDVTGDGVNDLLIGAGRGGGPRIEVVDGETGTVVKNFFVYEPTFTGGTGVAAGDVNGDGVDDLIVGTGKGGGPRIVAIDYATGDVLADFFAYESSFRGGVAVAAADVNKDGFDDYITGTGVGGAPRVAVYSGADPSVVLANFFAFDPSFRNGVNVSGADFDGDGAADIVVGAGAGGAPHVQVISVAGGFDTLSNFFAFDPKSRGGARVAVVDVNGDGESELIVGTPGHIRRFLRLDDPSQYLALDEFDSGSGTTVAGTNG